MSTIFTSLILASLLANSGIGFLTKGLVGYPVSEAEPMQVISQPTRLVSNTLGIETTAKSILVIDDNSEAILFSKNKTAVLPIASLTKLMTALVFLESNPDWNQKVAITDQDKKDGGIIYLIPGDEVTAANLFNLMLVASSNEAAMALSQIDGFDKFVGKMNQKAAELGMKKTVFVDPAGLDPANVSTAQDLAKLAKAVFTLPEILSALTRPQYELSVLNTKRFISAPSTDKLLGSFLNAGNGYKIIGGKTGYLDESGYCLAIKVQEAAGPAVILVSLGSKSQVDRWQEAKGLISWVFKNYQWPKGQ